jgi:uncharacterized protein YjbI with pentapeptide repeats
MACGFEYDRADGSARACPRPAVDGCDRCVFHLEPDNRREAGVDPGDLRAAVCADLGSGDRRRYEYVGVTADRLDLSSLVLDTDGVEPLRFRDVRVDGIVDLSESVVRSRIEFEDCDIGRLDATDATFESDVTVADSRFGSDGPGTCLGLRRGTVAGRLTVDDARLDGSAEFSGCRVEGWFEVDSTVVTGGVHFPNAVFDRAQFVDATFERSVQLTNVDATHLTVERVAFGPPPEFDGATLGTLRFRPSGDTACRLTGATVESGRLADAESGRALYDLTDATLGDVELAARPLSSYRFYRTEYDGFSFPDYREPLRDDQWRLHEYDGDPETPAEETGLERTYLEAKRGASGVGDQESAAAFLVREMRYRRRRYGVHARDASRTARHRLDAALRWATNAFLDATAGYGERPQRTVGTAVAVVLASALAYPAIGGLRRDGELVTYGSAGVEALATSLYFSVTTFATLGPGDVEPTRGLSQTLTGAEAFAGAFLVALFVFALGRQASR